MPVVIVLAIIDLACIGYLLSPAGNRASARQQDYYQLRAELTAKKQEVLPTRGMDNKLKQASADITGFYSIASRRSIRPCRRSWASWPAITACTSPP